MTWKDRFWGRRDQTPSIKTVVVGEGIEAERLARAYASCPEIELLPGSPRPLSEMDQVLRTPGLQAVEIVAPKEIRAELAADCLRAGLITSLDPPVSTDHLKEISWLARAYQTPLRFRLLPLYYAPFQKARELFKKEAVGKPFHLKLMVRRGKGTPLPPELDPAAWILEHELGFLALAEWMIGPVEKAYAKMYKSTATAPSSALLSWKYKQPHCFGYLQLDFCPQLHVRTFTDPVHRALELTGVGGLIFVTRAEGQLLRQQPLILRGKDTTIAFENIPDDWGQVYTNLALELPGLAQKKNLPLGHPDLALSALQLAVAGQKSAREAVEVRLSV